MLCVELFIGSVAREVGVEHPVEARELQDLNTGERRMVLTTTQPPSDQFQMLCCDVKYYTHPSTTPPLR
jgi:hypothetical protein